MKSTLLTLPLGLVLLLASCSSSEEQKTMVVKDQKMEQTPMKTKEYPKALDYIFKAHGGMDTWNGMQTLSYDMDKGEETEHQLIDLKSRKVKIEQDKFTLGFDGNEVWVTKKDTNTYKGDPRFYHNLYFYFFAMPFVLGDDGIQYEEAKALEVDGNTYPGLKIVYKDGVGDSSKDNYFLYYNPKTYQAEWLGYTVTYFDGKPSDKIHYLNFEHWNKVNGVLLPDVLTWYNIDEKTGEKTNRGSMKFTNIDINQSKKEEAFFQKTL